jgi:uncharacterized protein YbjT (DUF2867 family)
MVGQGVLRECLLDPAVEAVVTVGRTATGAAHAKLREVVRLDLYDLSGIETELTGFDACFFTLGTSAAGLSEEKYSRVTYDLTMSVARTLARLNPAMTFVYVSGQGTDTSEKGRMMWARVKGKTENALLLLPLKAYMFRPGLIQPKHGIKSKTALYRIPYMLLSPLVPVLRKVFPRHVTTTEQVGLAMLRVAREGYRTRILETADINSL